MHENCSKDLKKQLSYPARWNINLSCFSVEKQPGDIYQKALITFTSFTQVSLLLGLPSGNIMWASADKQKYASDYGLKQEEIETTYLVKVNSSVLVSTSMWLNIMQP